jgi:[calcium/calmodulin-dependent protein kinase] kinase
MSCEGPLLQVNPHHNPSPCYSPMASLNPRNCHLFRPRATSASGQMLQVPGSEDEIPPEPRSTPSSPTQLEPTTSLTLPLSAAFSRSASLPRGIRGRSAEPNSPLSNSATEQSLRSALSPRFIRRTATVDTTSMHKEEFEDFMLVNQYKVVGIIGSGSYGIVHKATTEENNTYAMKIVGKSRLRRKSFPVRPGKLGPRGRQATVGASPAHNSRQLMGVPSPLDNIHREIAILKKLDHPNVVNLIEVLDDPREDELIMVFEHIQKGSVMKEISPEETMSEDQAREYFIDIILGLEYREFSNS